jgi:hypothetical protein
VSRARRLELRVLVSDLLDSEDRGDDAKRLVYAQGLAWMTVADPRTTMEGLENARLALAAASESAGSSLGAVDALAALEFLLGRHELAERTLRDSIEVEGAGAGDASISRLAWYSWFNGTRVESSWLPTGVDEAPAREDSPLLASPVAYPKGLIAHILVLEDEQLRGFLRVRLGSLTAGRSRFAEGWNAFRGERPLSYRVTYVATPEEALPAASSQWRYWSWDRHDVEYLQDRTPARRESAEIP